MVENGGAVEAVHWRLTVLNRRTMRETPLAQKRSIDDSAEWLGDSQVLYRDGHDVRSVKADGSGTRSGS